MNTNTVAGAINSKYQKLKISITIKESLADDLNLGKYIHLV